jgi:hypothetical protein
MPHVRNNSDHHQFSGESDGEFVMPGQSIPGLILKVALTLRAAQASKMDGRHTVRFFVGSTDGTLVANVWTITHVLVTGVITHAGIQPIPPTPRWIAIAVASRKA